MSANSVNNEGSSTSSWMIPNGYGTHLGTDHPENISSKINYYDEREWLCWLLYVQHGTLWMNLGLGPSWDIAEASEALFRNLFSEIDMSNFQNVLDTSAGYGDQEITLHSMIPNMKYFGVNVSLLQNAIARHRAKSKDSVFLFGNVGSGVLADWPDEYVGSYDLIVSNENAFHYPSRDVYYTNCLRLLRPGGYVAVNDLIHHSVSKSDLQGYFEGKGYNVVALEDISSNIMAFKDMKRFFQLDVLHILGSVHNELFQNGLSAVNSLPFATLGSGIRNPTYWKIVLQKRK